jgi:prepilin-type N-terminal cleavage/methylation domain-containing protein
MLTISECRKRRRGYSLLELLAVIAIIGFIAGIAIPTYFGYVDKARITVSMSVLDALRKDIEVYHDQYQAYPASIDFTNFTDQSGNNVLFSITEVSLHSKMFSWDSYMASAATYTITAKAMDTNHTVLTLTPQGVTK